MRMLVPHSAGGLAADADQTSSTLFFSCGNRFIQTIRVALHDLGIQYTEQYPGDWMTEKLAGIDSGELAFGQLPRFKDADGTVLVQTTAILRYLGRKHKVYGASDAEATQIDMILEVRVRGLMLTATARLGCLST